MKIKPCMMKHSVAGQLFPDIFHLH